MPTLAPSILIVDDSESTRYVYRRALESLTSQIEEAATGKEALAKATTALFDLVITDIVMPEADGIELIQAFKRSARRPRILAISGAVNASNYLQAALLLGADAVLAKPVDEQQLVEAVIRLLNGPR